MEKFIAQELNLVVFNTGIAEIGLQSLYRKFFKTDAIHTFHEGQYLIGGRGFRYLECENLIILIHGEIYEGEDLLNTLSFDSGDITSIKNSLLKMNGSFAMVLISKNTQGLFVITDRINSKRIYYCRDDQKTILTTQPGYFSSIDNKVSAGGVASCLINGSVFNNYTLYENIKAFDRASLHSIKNGKINSTEYWHYEFTNEYAGIPKEDLREEFKKLLLQSVERRLKALKPDTCYLSLSGGYDSRFLLGALREMKEGFKLKTFSYGMVGGKDAGDDVVASNLAKLAGVEHHFEPAYTNDVMKTIKANSFYGHGMANFCDEVEAWQNLGQIFSQNSSAVLFVGDMFYHSSYDLHRVTDKRLPLQRVKIHPWYYIKPLLSLLPKVNQHMLISAYNDLYEGILKRLPETDDYQVIKDFAYIDQRVSHTLCYWRTFFQAPFIRVTQPLLDNDILDYFRKLPDELRFGKIFYKDTVKELFPDLFKIPIANTLWEQPDWLVELINEKESVLNNYKGRSSLLDEIVSIQCFTNAIKDLKDCRRQYKTNPIQKMVKILISKNDVLNGLFGELVMKSTHLSYINFIIRLLNVRESLIRGNINKIELSEFDNYAV